MSRKLAPIKSAGSETCRLRLQVGAFSLVEVTVAIGIFAFVAVAILGLMPAALRQRAESALDSRSVLIAEELFATVKAAPSISNVAFRRGPALRGDNFAYVDLTLPSSDRRSQLVLGYPAQTTVPYYFFWNNPGASWTNAGGNDPDVRKSEVNLIETLARVSATSVGGNLYQVTVEVRSPASSALANTKPNVFNAFIYSP
jgi:hypothetical protein